MINIYNINEKELKNIDCSIFFENVPKNVRMVSAMIQHAGFEAYLVGGCVRDHFTGNIPNDYDFCTNATPEQIISLFPRTFYENVYGTVGIVTLSEEEAKEKALKNLENLNTNKGVVAETVKIEDFMQDVSISQETNPSFSSDELSQEEKLKKERKSIFLDF